ncbi:MAG: hypothetical protein ACR2F6_19445 [Mycobacteriales bacterium]
MLAALADSEQDPAELRRKFREFVRANHPDLGGDPAEFARRLRDYQKAMRGGGLAADDPRLNGPIVVVRRRTLLGAALHRLRQRYRPPRVR